MSILHVVGAVFIVGPMAILPMSAMRAVRAGNAGQVATLAKSTNLFGLLSLLVVVFGFGVMGMAPKSDNVSITTPWILWSLILYIVAFALTVFLVVPTMRKAAEALEAKPGTDAVAEKASYPALAAGSGVTALLLVAVVVLMVWKP